jgi:hypothetical protein
LNNIDFTGQDFDTFLESIKQAGAVDWNLNEVDTSQFKSKL